MIEQGGTLAIVKGNWKYIQPSNGEALQQSTNTEMSNSKTPQLYDLSSDIGEKKNVAEIHPDIVKQLAAELEKIKNNKNMIIDKITIE